MEGLFPKDHSVTVAEFRSLKQLGVVDWAILQPFRGHLDLVQNWNSYFIGRPCEEYGQGEA